MLRWMSRNNDGKARGNSQRDPSYNQASHTKERLAVPKAQMVTGPRTGYCVLCLWNLSSWSTSSSHRWNSGTCWRRLEFAHACHQSRPGGISGKPKCYWIHALILLWRKTVFASGLLLLRTKLVMDRRGEFYRRQHHDGPDLKDPVLDCRR